MSKITKMSTDILFMRFKTLLSFSGMIPSKSGEMRFAYKQRDTERGFQNT